MTSVSPTARARFRRWRRAVPPLALALLAACSGESGSVAARTSDLGPPPTPVVVRAAEVRSIEERFLVREATLYPISRARISTRQEGFVRERFVEEGDLVFAGDPLAELDDSDRRLRLAELQASLKRATTTLSEKDRQWKRGQGLFRRKVISTGERDDLRAALDRARADVDERRARVEQTEQAIAQLRIVAPMDSIVSARFIEQGEYLERGDPVVELKRIDTIVAIGTVGERDLHDVRQGSPARVSVTAFPGRSFEGLVWKIIPDAQLESRSFPVWVILPNPDFELKPGMSAQIGFVRSLAGALLVPKDAVLREQDDAFVFVVSQDQVERRKIEIGESIGESWHVRSGLGPEDLVVVTGNEELETGQRVRIVELPPPGPPTLPPRLKAAQGDARGS